MFIHIGNSNVIRSAEIISIVDYNIISSSTIMDEMIKANKDKIIGQKEDAKSIVITDDHLFFSTLSVPTLKKRAGIMSIISKLDDYSNDLDIE